MTVTLRAMTDAELSVRLVAQIEDYAEDLVRSGRATLADARERSTIAHATLLPDGVRTQGQLVFGAVVDGATVGWIWLALPGSSPSRVDLAWIFNVEIDSDHRGRGYGRGILVAGERALTDRGVARLGLNVFGHNPVARRLYDSLGYELTARQLVKDLVPPPAPPKVTLRPMTERELRSWLADRTDVLVGRLVEAGEATAAEAPGAVRASIAARLPDGVATPGQLAYVGEVDGDPVGRIWAALPGSGGQQRPDTAWIYDVDADPNGHRLLVEALERGLAARGIPRLGLTVYGPDTAASRVYDSLGFQVTSAQMVKSLV